jgi:hypothetical protein
MRARKPGVDVRVIRSWEELQREIFVDSFAHGLERYRSSFAFRGMCGDWDLSTSLQRLRHPSDRLRTIEHAMFRSFRKYAYSDADPSASEWKWLALAQHHGLPTRLLDWTYSPLVAMHFATNELREMDKDGVIWMVNFVATCGFLPTPMATTLRERAAYSFTVEMLEATFAEIASVEQLKGDLPEFVVFFEPPSLDPRIVNQYGLFSFLNRPDVLLHEWLQEACTSRPGLARKLVIPAGLKWEIRDKLDNMNITERVLMPGLDGLSAWLRRWYSPKSAHPVAAPRPPRRASHSAAPAVSSASGRRPTARSAAGGRMV